MEISTFLSGFLRGHTLTIPAQDGIPDIRITSPGNRTYEASPLWAGTPRDTGRFTRGGSPLRHHLLRRLGKVWVDPDSTTAV